MKKVLVSILGLAVLSSVFAISANAQGGGGTKGRARYDQSVRRHEQRNYDRRYYDQRRVGPYSSNQVYDSVYGSNVYNDPRYDGYYYDDRSVWERSRDKITTAVGAGAGAALGGIIGGKKGAIIGAIAGGGGAAIYTYGIRDKDRYRY